MGITLTEMFQEFLGDLDRLSAYLKIAKQDESEAWKASREIADEAFKIDDNPVFYGRKGQKKIEELSVKIGSPYVADRNLPDITTPQDLLFAMIYYKRLQNYQNISEGNSILVDHLSAKKPDLLKDAAALKQRIDDYCGLQENIEVIYQAFPECDRTAADPILEKLQKVLAKKPLPEKLASQFEVDFNANLFFYNENKDLKKFLTDLETSINTKEQKLREIAVYSKLLELLKNKQITSDTEKLPDEYSKLEAYWGLLRKNVEESTPLSIGSNLARATAITAKTIGSGVYWGVSWFGFMTPNVIQNRLINFSNTISGLVDAATPESPAEKKNRQLISEVEARITDLAAQLNNQAENQDENSISASDFSDISSEQVNELAEKTALIRRMVHIQKCMEQYKSTHASDWVKVSLGIFKNLTSLFSKTFLKRLMFDKVLLCMQVDKFQGELNQLIKHAEGLDMKDKDSVESVKEQLKTSLDKTKGEGETIKKKSLFAFFKGESEQAHEELKEIVDTTSSFIPKND